MSEARDPLTEQIIAAAFEVANTLGHGFLEAVYRRAMVHELSLRGLSAAEEVHFDVSYKGKTLGRYVADLIVEERVIVELKSAEGINQAHVAQVLNYLRASRIRTGLLINFGRARIEFRRLVI